MGFNYQSDLRSVVTNAPVAYGKNGEKLESTGKVVGPMGEVFKTKDGSLVIRREVQDEWGKRTEYFDSQYKPTHNVEGGKLGTEAKINVYAQKPIKIGTYEYYKTVAEKNMDKHGKYTGGISTETNGNVETTYDVSSSGQKYILFQNVYDGNKPVKFIDFVNPGSKAAKSRDMVPGQTLQSQEYDAKTGKIKRTFILSGEF